MPKVIYKLESDNQAVATVRPKQLNPIIHIIWGIALTLMGIAVFFRIPEVMPKIAAIKIFSSVLFFVKFCFYLLGVLLIWGGANKIYNHHHILTGKKRNISE